MPLRPPNVILNQALWFNPVGNHSQVTVTTAAVTLAPPTGADKLMVQVSGTLDARYAIGGTVAPTTAKGFVLKADDPPMILPIDLSTNIVVIGESTSENTVIEYQWGGTHRA